MHNHTYKWQLEPVPLRKEQPNPALKSEAGQYVLSAPRSPESHPLLFPGPQGLCPGCSGHLQAPLHSASCQEVSVGVWRAEDSEVMSVYFFHLLLAWEFPQLQLYPGPFLKAQPSTSCCQNTFCFRCGKGFSFCRPLGASTAPGLP